MNDKFSIIDPEKPKQSYWIINNMLSPSRCYEIPNKNDAYDLVDLLNHNTIKEQVH